ncbi:C39 family peptidase [Magnetospirillum sp. UT-4]|uniref:C39 family peptidase n=1 Tax=Magnetospirillum sp. UT-4 TaxID=2681467 RepID=UPI0013847C75|nr:C39 family peptidase [Magnetospirillum sp. UT-4]CAA7623927.1 Peptidase C39 bacteriocin processing [Magnetospirillum sp. UT-4]
MNARIAAALLILAAPAFPAKAGEVGFALPSGNLGVSVASLREARFRGVVRQERDYSCGSAAVATLLTHHYRRPITEAEVFTAMYAAGDQETIRRQGFSLLDMQRYLATLGLKADGYRVGLDKLIDVGVPAITLITIRGYSHFVVIKGVEGGDVLVGDPAMGVRAVPRAEFESQWQGVLFVVRDDIDIGRMLFNRPADWAVRRKAPFGTALSRQGLSTLWVALPGLFEF